MGLGNRSARRHESAKTAGVNAEDFWDFKPGQTVMTVDGFLGKVTAVEDGFAGNETYVVTLDNGLGGGDYNSGQLTAVRHAEATTANTASVDYPELAEILAQRPDPGKYPESTMGMVASLQSHAVADQESCSHNYVHNGHGHGGDEDHSWLLDHQPQGPSKWSSLQTQAVSPEEWAKANMPSHSDSDRSSEGPAFACKTCGAASPDGIGYAAHSQQTFPAPHPDCPNPHYGDTPHPSDGWMSFTRRQAGVGSIQHVEKGTPEYKGHYQRGWASGQSGSMNALEGADGRNEPHAWYDGYMDSSVGRPKWSLMHHEDSEAANAALDSGWTPPARGKMAAFFTEQELREVGQAEAERQGKSAEEILSAQASAGVCDNGHLTWDGKCASCRDASTDSNSMVTNPGDHRPQNVENIKNAVHDDSPYNSANYRPECDICGGGHATHNHGDDDGGHDGGSGQATASLEHGYALVRQAMADPSFGFMVTAAWKDVRNKARRIRAEGGVHITAAQNGYYIAQVKGDHGTYESVLLRAPGSQKVAQWDCGCTWAKYHWGAPDDFSRFAGRMCSHALALHLEAQSQGMFGRDVTPSEGNPNWLMKTDLALTSSLNLPDVSILDVLSSLAIAAGEEVGDINVLRSMAAVSSPFGEPSPTPIAWVPGPTKPKNPDENPASAGFLTAHDPADWNQQGPSLGGTFGARQERFLEVLAAVAPVAEAVAPMLEGMAEGGATTEAAPAAEAEGGGAEGGGGGERPRMPGMPKIPGMGGDPMKKANEFAQHLKAWTDRDAKEGEDVRQSMNSFRNLATMHDEPEPALPSTDGSEGDDLTDSLDYADPNESVFTTADSHEASFRPFDEPLNRFAEQQGMEPFTQPQSLVSDPSANLEPTDQSMATMGSLEAATSVDDIVAQFQATSSLGGGSGAAAVTDGGASLIAASKKGNSDIAAAARAFLEGGQEALTRTAMAVFTPAQQQEMINEGAHGPGASNLDRLQIEGTHYEALDAMASNDDDTDTWLD